MTYYEIPIWLAVLALLWRIESNTSKRKGGIKLQWPEWRVPRWNDLNQRQKNTIRECSIVAGAMLPHTLFFLIGGWGATVLAFTIAGLTANYAKVEQDLFQMTANYQRAKIDEANMLDTILDYSTRLKKFEERNERKREAA